MPSDQLPSTPFTKRLEFAGRFEDGEKKSQPFSIEVVYSTINGHPPTGIVRGTSKEYDALEAFFYKRRRVSALCTIRSTSLDRPSILCTDVLIGGIGTKIFPRDEQETIHLVIGHFSIGELTVRTVLPGKREEFKRQRTFILEGPSKLWLSNAYRSVSYTGAIRSRRQGSNFSLKGAPHDKISVAPNFFYAEHYRKDYDHRETIQFERFSLVVTDSKKVERDEQKFSDNAAEVTERLCLLISFLSKARIDWSSSTYFDGRVHVETYRDVPVWKGKEPGWEELVVGSKELRRFLNKAFTTYDKRTKKGFDLRLPMLHYIAAQTSRYAEDRFTVLFFAFEKLLSSLDAGTKKTLLLTDKELKSLWADMKPALTKMRKSTTQIDLIREKRAELQRYPLKHRVLRHLKPLRIDISDIGAEAGLVSMIKTRNLIAHSHGEVPIKTVVFERRRLETIVERMLLTLLGWKKHDHTPTYWNRPIEDKD